jgi:hypothetical protein
MSIAVNDRFRSLRLPDRTGILAKLDCRILHANATAARIESCYNPCFACIFIEAACDLSTGESRVNQDL